jgi:hypothetical protein
MNIDETVSTVLRLDAEATPGPWTDLGTQDREVWCCAIDDPHEAECVCQDPEGDDRPQDRTLIAQYRTAAPALAREVRRLQIILEACDERSQMCLEAVEEADAELRAALDEIERLHACALPSEGAYISGRVDGERIGFRAGQEAMRERAAALCRARAEVNEQTAAEVDEAEYLADAIRALEVGHD